MYFKYWLILQLLAYVFNNSLELEEKWMILLSRNS